MYKNGKPLLWKLETKKFNGLDGRLLRQQQICENFVVALLYTQAVPNLHLSKLISMRLIGQSTTKHHYVFLKLFYLFIK